jgi:hypothetical protein
MQAFQSDDAPAVSKPFELPKLGLNLGGSKKAPETKAAKVEVESTSSGGIDVRSIALPGALILIGGLGAAATALDPEFGGFMDKATIRDSSIQGVGYEGAIKSTYTGVIYEADPDAPKRKAAPTKPAPKKGKK